MARKTNRKHSIIDGLDPALKATVEQMLLTNATYSDVVDYLAEQGVGISVASVCRYAQAYQADVQTLTIAQENFRRMMDELEKYPNLDTTEAIIRIASQNLLTALTNTDETKWDSIKPAQMLKEATGLIRAAAYKKQIEAKTQEISDAGLDAVQSLVFETMAKERPDLYQQVSAFLATKKQEGLS